MRRTVKMTEAPPRKGSLVVGDRVGELLAAAEEEAQRIGRDVHEEVAAIRSRSDRAVAVGVAELEGDVERIKSEAVAEAQVARAEAERYAVEQLHAANERAAQIIAKAEVRAKARRAAADEAARLVDEAYRRQTALREAAEALEAHLRDGVDERLQAAQRSLQNLAGSIGEFMGEPQGEDNDEPAVAETIRAPRPPQAMRTAR